MNREGAETFLRLLAEAEMRGQLAPIPPPWAGGPGAGRVKVKVVGQALTAVGAIGSDTVEDILADFDLAVGVRRLHDQAGQGPAGAGTGRRTDCRADARRVGGPVGRSASVRPLRTAAPGGQAAARSAARADRTTGPGSPAATRSRPGSGCGRQVRADRPDHPVS